MGGFFRPEERGEGKMNTEALNPHIRHARRSVSRFVVRRGVSRCYDSRLFYFENTEGSITVENVKYNISNKTAVFLPPLSRYVINIKVNDGTAVSVFNFDLTKEHSDIRASLGTPTVSEFDPELVPDCAMITGFTAPIVKRSSRISAHISGSVSAFEEGRGEYLERASAYLKLALIELIDDGERECSPLCKSILAYISEHLSDPSMTNEAIAAHFNYHPYYINRLLKRELGVSLRSYIIGERLDAAERGLSETSDPVSEIAERSGFSSTSYFVKTFKARSGVTPLEYRRRIRSVEL